MTAIAWTLIALIHLLITAQLAAQFNRYDVGTNESTPSISIVIAAHNELENLQKLIPKLSQLNYPDFEIIIALDRCTDESANYLQTLKNSSIRFIEISETSLGWNGKKYALKTAIDQAKNDWLVFTDADCIPTSSKWLCGFSKAMEEGKNILLGYSPYSSGSTFLSSYIQFESFSTGFLYLSSALSSWPYMAVGRNMAVRKSFFEASGGYLEFKSIQGGDDDLFIQKNATDSNTRVVLGKDSLVETYPKKTWKEYLQQKLRHLSIGFNYRFIHKTFLSLYHSSHFLFWILLLFQNNFQIITSVVLFYLFIKLGSYRFAVSKMGSGFNYILLPLVDILYAVLTPVIAFWSKLEKDIRWKN